VLVSEEILLQSKCGVEVLLPNVILSTLHNSNSGFNKELSFMVDL